MPFFITSNILSTNVGFILKSYIANCLFIGFMSSALENAFPLEHIAIDKSHLSKQLRYSYTQLQPG
jgi:hypothetical protein